MYVLIYLLKDATYMKIDHSPAKYLMAGLMSQLKMFVFGIKENDMNVIVATSTQEQENIIEYLMEELKVMHHTDVSVSVLQTGIGKVDVMQNVNGTLVLAKRYKVIIIPISMSLDGLKGLPHSTNFNINRLIKKLDRMKAEAVGFVNAYKTPSLEYVRQREALAKAAKHLFD
jgi:hypothetical protein